MYHFSNAWSDNGSFIVFHQSASRKLARVWLPCTPTAPAFCPLTAQNAARCCCRIAQSTRPMTIVATCTGRNGCASSTRQSRPCPHPRSRPDRGTPNHWKIPRILDKPEEIIPCRDSHSLDLHCHAELSACVLRLVGNVVTLLNGHGRSPTSLDSVGKRVRNIRDMPPVSVISR